MRTNFTRLVILAIAVLLFVAVAFRFARRSPRTVGHAKALDVQSSALPESSSAASSLSADNVTPPTTVAVSSPITVRQIPPNAAAAKAPPVPPAPNDPAMLEIDQVNLMIRDYRTLAGENPIGTNAEIMASLMGGNPKQAKIGPPEGAKLNEKGELLDRWGTPYFFHQLSRDHMEIRSAGPDKVMWNEDDPVIR